MTAIADATHWLLDLAVATAAAGDRSVVLGVPGNNPFTVYHRDRSRELREDIIVPDGAFTAGAALEALGQILLPGGEMARFSHQEWGGVSLTIWPADHKWAVTAVNHAVKDEHGLFRTAVRDEHDFAAELTAATAVIRDLSAAAQAAQDRVRVILADTKLPELIRRAGQTRTALGNAQAARDLAAARLLGRTDADYAHTNNRDCTASPTGMCVFVEPGIDECAVCRLPYDAETQEARP